jgi:hypothetical protein
MWVIFKQFTILVFIKAEIQFKFLCSENPDKNSIKNNFSLQNIYIKYKCLLMKIV